MARRFVVIEPSEDCLDGRGEVGIVQLGSDLDQHDERGHD